MAPTHFIFIAADDDAASSVFTFEILHLNFNCVLSLELNAKWVFIWRMNESDDSIKQQTHQSTQYFVIRIALKSVAFSDIRYHSFQFFSFLLSFAALSSSGAVGSVAHSTRGGGFAITSSMFAFSIYHRHRHFYTLLRTLDDGLFLRKTHTHNKFFCGPLV